MTNETLVQRLRDLCSPNAEMLSDKARIDAFVKYGSAVADALEALTRAGEPVAWRWHHVTQPGVWQVSDLPLVQDPYIVVEPLFPSPIPSASTKIPQTGCEVTKDMATAGGYALAHMRQDQPYRVQAEVAYRAMRPREPSPSIETHSAPAEGGVLSAILRLTSEDDAPPTESILRPLADRGKSADPFDQAQEKRRQAAALITDAEALEQLAYDTADYCGGGEE